MTTTRRDPDRPYPAAVLLLIGACLLPVAPAGGQEGREDGLEIATFEEEETGLVCPKGRYIGVLTDSSPRCPDAENGKRWAQRPLFCPDPQLGAEQGGNRHGGEGGADNTDCLKDLPTRLRPFCLYSWEGPFEVPDDGPFGGEFQDEFQDTGQPESDCFVAGGLATEAFARRRAEVFAAEAGRPASPGRGSGSEGQPGAGARLVIVDGSPAAEPGDPDPPQDYECELLTGSSVCSEHGQALVRMARHLLCADPGAGSCLAAIATRRALNHSYRLVHPGASPQLLVVGEGGSGVFGGGGEIAEDLGGEIAAAVAGTGRLDRVVINLSLGWNGLRYGGWEDSPAQMRTGLAAVHAAIEEATCRGALVFAAAGNFSGGDRPAGVDRPFLPAGWAARTVRCDESTTLPLLHSVGGVDAAGHALANSRLGAMPRLVAFGDHATTCRAEVAGGCGSPVLTGSSVAAVVVSAAAAAYWALHTDATSGEVADALFATGLETELKVTAFGLPHGPVRRVKVCRAIGVGCPPPVEPLPRPDLDPTTIHPVVTSPTGCPPPGVIARLAAAAGRDETWLGDGAERLLSRTPPPAPACPHWQLDGPADTPWSGPQPDDETCDECGFTKGGSGRLRIALKPLFTVQGVPVEKVTAVRLKVGRTVLAVADELPLFRLDGGSKVAAEPLVLDLDHPIVGGLCPGDQALLTMQVDNGTGSPLAISSPVLIQDVAGLCSDADESADAVTETVGRGVAGR